MDTTTESKKTKSSPMYAGWTQATVHVLNILRKNNPYNVSEEDKIQITRLQTMPDPKNNRFSIKSYSLQDS